MKRKNEDRLVRLAFGDLPLEESAALEQQTSHDPESARALAEYREMRDGLRALADVPPHQLSNERLREAILGRGLKPHAPEPILSWLWMPATAACLVAVMLIAYQRTRPIEPQIIGMPASASARNDFAIKWEPGSHSAFAEAKAPTRKSVPSVGPSALKLASSEAANPTRRHRHRSDEMDQALLAEIFLTTDEPAGAPAGAAGAATSPSDSNPTANLRPVDDKPSSTVVLIDPDMDQNTGASSATEVGSGKNVVVGG